MAETQKTVCQLVDWILPASAILFATTPSSTSSILFASHPIPNFRYPVSGCIHAGPKQPPYNLMNWVYLKGSVPVMEALLRGHHRPRDLGDCCDASTALTFLIALASDTPAVLPACLSIASTLHKLLREQGREVVECRAVSWGAEAEESEAMKATFGQNLVTLLSCMCWAAVEVPIASYPVTARSVCSGDESCDTNSSGGSSISGSSGSSCTNKTAELERQARLQRGLRAVVALSLLQFEEMRMHFDGRPPVLFQPAWLQSLALDDPDLAVVLWQQLSASGRPTSGHAAGLANWEQYTLQHFHGRLLPSCCHVGCTNLAGVSEAALQTWLCSGCRRARYCSIQCQRAAWTSHALVCIIPGKSS